MSHSAAITKKANRRKLDQYFTPAFATRELLDRVAIKGNVFECCHGDAAITNAIQDHASAHFVWTNDIDESLAADFHYDVSRKDAWARFGAIEWVVSNPPFNQAAQIIPLAYEHASIGIAMLLRLSYLEPTEDRGAWLNKHPPTQMIVLPRISFSGDGKTDSVTCAWMVWEKNKQGTITIAENPKFSSTT